MKRLLLIALVVLLMSPMVYAADKGFDTDMKTLYKVSQLVTDVDAVNIQKRFDWDAGGLIIYKGVAASGNLSSSGDWKIFKYSYEDADSATSPSLVQASDGAWTGRTSLTYK